jgi:hypothetical protein
VRVLCQTGVPGPVQRGSEVASGRHALDRCVEYLRDARGRHRLAQRARVVATTCGPYSSMTRTATALGG